MSAAGDADTLGAAVLIFSGLIFCETCNREANPDAPIFTDEEYAAQADAMRKEGWTSPDGEKVYCPKCSRVPG